MKTLKEGTTTERVERLKNLLITRKGSNLVLDGAYFNRVLSLCSMYGLEELRISEVREIIQEVHDKEIREIAEWSLRFKEGIIRDTKISNEVIDLLDGFNYEVVREINRVASELEA